MKAIRIDQIGTLPAWRVTSRDRSVLAMTFARMQEYYESADPEFQGKIFSFEQFKAHYCARHAGKFSYANRSRFNVPSSAVLAVFRNFPDHSAEEKRLFRRLKKLGAFDLERFYLIGCFTKNPRRMEHELRHMLFFVNDEYRNDVLEKLKLFPVPALRQRLREMGFAENLLDDEVQAHALVHWPRKMIVDPDMRALKRALRSVEQKYLQLLPPL